jgi:hypothetical protein
VYRLAKHVAFSKARFPVPDAHKPLCHPELLMRPMAAEAQQWLLSMNWRLELKDTFVPVVVEQCCRLHPIVCKVAEFPKSCPVGEDNMAWP